MKTRRHLTSWAAVLAAILSMQPAARGKDPGSGLWTGLTDWCSTPPPPPGVEQGTYVFNTWPGGVVPYAFASNPGQSNYVSPEKETKMRQAMDILEATANLQFIPRTTEPDYVLVENRAAPCDASTSQCVGRCGGGQYIRICESHWDLPGILMHEVMHGLGLWHEQQRSDRDQYVQIHPALLNNGNYTIRGTPHGPYDFASLMHYADITIINGNFERAITVRAPYTRTWQYELDHSLYPDAMPSRGDSAVLQHLYGGNPLPRYFALSAPAGGTAVGDAWTPSFSWEASDAATSYHLQVDRSPLFDSPEVDVATMETSYVHATPLEPQRLYWWRVIASNDLGTTESYPFAALTFYTAPAYPATLHVDDSAPAGGDGTSWASPLRDLALALETAYSSGGDIAEVSVAQGVYTPDFGSGDRDKSFWLPDACAVLGGYAGYGAPDPDARDIDLYETTLSGDLDGDDEPGFVNISDNSRNVIVSLFNPSSTLLEGFTIRGGNGDPRPNQPGVGSGALLDGTHLVIRRCRFIGNHAEQAGGGVAVNFSGAAPRLQQCTFAGNRVLLTAPDPFFGGLNFGGGGIFAVTTGVFHVIDCVFDADMVQGGGGAVTCQFAGPALTNCMLIGNSAAGTAGGGAVLGLGGSQLTLRDCTVVGNTSAGAGGAIRKDSSSVLTVANSILWGNSPGQISSTGTVANVTYSDVQGGWGGTGNINLDPLFVNVGTGDYHLAAGSPCIDAGSSEWVPSDTFDLDGDGDTAELIPLDLGGNPRFFDDLNTPDTGIGLGPIVDMGAFEYPCHLDSDGDSVTDCLDLCPNTVPGAAVDPENGCPPPIPGDFNRDGDVDAGDLEVFESCASGPAVPHDGTPTCRQADFDDDNDVDQSDFSQWQRCYSGEDHPADPDCAD